MRLLREVGLCESQHDFAKTVGFAPRTIGNAERGTHPPSLALRRALDQALEHISDAQRDRFLAAVAALGPDDNDNKDKYVPESEESVVQRTLAICGSRSAGTDVAVIDAAIRELARFVMLTRCKVQHGPVGVGIEVITYIADHYRLPDLTMAIGLFGRNNVVRDVDYVLVVGGGSGTADEIDLALRGGTPVIPFPAGGGAAAAFYARARRDIDLRLGIPDPLFDALASCDAEEFVSAVRAVLNHEGVMQ
ncbi:MAG: hypothetical protein ACRDTF_15420 [Pseudonocardiaceae bacterium]